VDYGADLQIQAAFELDTRNNPPLFSTAVIH
jgi:hypothetical protein